MLPHRWQGWAETQEAAGSTLAPTHLAPAYLLLVTPLPGLCRLQRAFQVHLSLDTPWLKGRREVIISF